MVRGGGGCELMIFEIVKIGGKHVVPDCCDII